MRVRLADDELVRAIQGAPENAALPAPAELSAVEDAEDRIGFAIPPLLRRLYLEVANGGFGPRGDMVGVRALNQSIRASLPEQVQDRLVQAQPDPAAVH